MKSLIVCLLISALNQVSNSFKLTTSKLQKRRSRGSSNYIYTSSLPTSTLSSTASNELDFDVAIVGGGIAGTSLAWLLQEQQNCKVALIDSRANAAATWYPNYGEWRDEWHTLSERLKFPELKECTTTEWEVTDCFFGGSYDIPTDQRLTLPRPYVRVDRVKLQKVLRDKFAAKGGQAINGKLLAQRISPNLFDGGLVHDARGSKLKLDNGVVIKSKVVVDATGLESRLTSRESSWAARGSATSYPVGFQIAYGFIAYVTSLGPYDLGAMTLFDYRTSYLDDEPEWRKQAEDKPTVCSQSHVMSLYVILILVNNL